MQISILQTRRMAAVLFALLFITAASAFARISSRKQPLHNCRVSALLGWKSCFLPRLPASGHGKHIGVTHLLQIFG